MFSLGWFVGFTACQSLLGRLFQSQFNINGTQMYFHILFFLRTFQDAQHPRKLFLWRCKKSFYWDEVFEIDFGGWSWAINLLVYQKKLYDCILIVVFLKYNLDFVWNK